MKFTKTPIADVVLVEPEVFGDARGFFMETWQEEKFKQPGSVRRTCKTITAARPVDLAGAAFTGAAPSRQAGEGVFG